MHFDRKQTFVIIIGFILMFSMMASTNMFSTASAHTPAWKIPTFAFVASVPNPVGVGQTALIYMFLDKTYDATAVTNDYRFHNYQLSITDPNGTTTSITFPTINDPTSNQGYSFTPTQVGNYTLFFNFPGQNVNDYDHASDTFVNDTYLPSNATTVLEVTQSPIQNIPTTPLPNSYWTRPIYGENPNWYVISSNWLGTGSPVESATGTGNLAPFSSGFAQSYIQCYPGDAIGPLTSHVMWTKPLQEGGVAGGNDFQIQGNTYFEGSAYNQRFTNPIILNGYLYFTETLSMTGNSNGPTDCVDLRTGQLIWSRYDVPALSFGYVYDVEDPNQHGVFPAILFTANFARAFDALTGDPLFNVTNVPSGTNVMGPQGEILKYVFANSGNTTNPAYYLGEWNSSKLWQYAYPPVLSPTMYNATTVGSTYGDPESATGGAPSAISFPQTGTNKAGEGAIDYNSIPSTVVTANDRNPASPYYNYDWNVSVPWLNTMGAATIGSSQGANPITVIAAFYDNMMICRNGSLPSFQQQSGYTSPQTPYTYFAIDLNTTHSTFGQVLWYNTVALSSLPAYNMTVTVGGADPTAWNGNGYGVFIEEYRETLNFGGYSMATGAKLWTTPPQTALDYYGSPSGGVIVSQVAYGNLYTSGYAGILYCYNLTTGALEWTYGNGPYGSNNSTEAGYGKNPTFINAVGNGILYLVSSEHTVETPIYKGATAEALNATTGQKIWQISDITNEFSAMSYAIADGYSTFFNGYDNQIYSLGRGPSDTTVSAPSAGLAFGQPMVISGTVTDISAGTQQNEQAMDFPNGVPVCSDASMADWMGYVYQQQAMPTDFTGVPVQIYVLDSNGNNRLIGTATTDTSGTYRLTWTPDISGNYTVYAQFAGTNGYWPSSAESGFTVMQAAEHPTVAPTQAPSAADQFFVPAIAGLFVLIIIVAIVLALLMLRKRP